FRFKNQTMITFASRWEADHGKQLQAWSAIADALGQSATFGLKKTGPAIKTRFDVLMSRFVRGESASLRKSGTAEEYEEGEQLMQDIKTRMDDFKASETIRKDVCRRKLEGIENSGTLLRKMALGELERSSHEEAGTQKRKKRKATAPSIDMNNLIHAIQAGIDDKRRREELITEQSAARLEFDREQAANRTEQHHANQRMMMELISAIAKRIE
ncbi:hypothetical protein DYB32_009265, partial [Aphanomyces invadans]